MELYKVINGKVTKYKGGFIVLDNKIYTNPTEELVRQAGYKPLVADEQPEYDVETQYLNEMVGDTEDNILIHWEVKDIELIEDETGGLYGVQEY